MPLLSSSSLLLLAVALASSVLASIPIPANSLPSVVGGSGKCESLLDRPSLVFEHAARLPTLRDRTVRQGGTLQLTCAVSGAPQATIIWLHNGKEVAVHDGPHAEALYTRKRIGHGTVLSQLRIPCVTEAAAGTYSCVAFSACAGPIERTAQVTIKPSQRPPACLSAPAAVQQPYISLFTDTRLELVGNPVHLMCRSSSPSDDIRWERIVDEADDGTFLTAPLDDISSGVMQLANGDLIVLGSLTAALPDGMPEISFRCTVSNAAGEAHADSVVITLNE